MQAMVVIAPAAIIAQTTPRNERNMPGLSTAQRDQMEAQKNASTARPKRKNCIL